MPFGTLFAALVYAVLGTWMGLRVAAIDGAPAKMMGWSLVVLSLALAMGLLAKRAWARWLSALGGTVLVAAGIVGLAAGGGGSVELLLVLAGILSSILLLVPATGRPRIDSTAVRRPTLVGRLLAGAVVAGVAGIVAAAAWGVARVAPTIATALASASAPAEAAMPVTAEHAKWLDFAPGLSAAKSSRKLMVVDFYATWCNPCKIMEKRTFKDRRVEARLRDVVPVRVDSEEEVEREGLKGVDLALRYAIESYPTIVVIDGEGREVARNVGMMGPDEFLSWLDAVLERASTAVARR